MKQSQFVVSLLLASGAAKHLGKRPPNVQLFADGMEEDTAELVEQVAFGDDGSIAVGKQAQAQQTANNTRSANMTSTRRATVKHSRRPTGSALLGCFWECIWRRRLCFFKSENYTLLKSPIRRLLQNACMLLWTY